MTPRISNAIDVFLDALNEGTLVKGDCAACAVGNLAAHGMGKKLNKNLEPVNDEFGVKNNDWSPCFVTLGGRDSVFYEENSHDPIFKYFEFTPRELAVIERAFETNAKIHHLHYKEYSPEEIFADQLKGLQAVIVEMLNFDDCKDIVEEIFTNKAVEQYNERCQNVL